MIADTDHRKVRLRPIRRFPGDDATKGNVTRILDGGPAMRLDVDAGRTVGSLVRLGCLVKLQVRPRTIAAPFERPSVRELR